MASLILWATGKLWAVVTGWAAPEASGADDRTVMALPRVFARWARGMKSERGRYSEPWQFERRRWQAPSVNRFVEPYIGRFVGEQLIQIADRIDVGNRG